MFDYKAKIEDELDLKKGDVIVILNKVWKHLLTLFVRLGPLGEG